MSDLFKRLREQSSTSRDTGAPSSPYSFNSGGYSPFSSRPGSGPPTVAAAGQRQGEVKRTAEGDRPHAYLPPPETPRQEVPVRRPEPFFQPSPQMPPVVRQPEVVQEWEPPTFTEILKDLGLRVLEVVIAAGAYAAGEEIAYFFRRRRFYTDDQVKRREW